MIGAFDIILAFVAITVAPGPATLALAQVSMSRGRLSGAMFGAGLALGLGFWGVLAGLGLGAVLLGSAQVLFVLKTLGAMYLLYLAYGAAKTAIAPKDEGASPVGNVFWAGLILNLSNPKAVFAWLAVLTLGAGSFQTAGLVGALSLSGAAVYAAIALIFSIPIMRGAYRRFARWISACAAVLFGWFAYRLFTLRVAAVA